MLRVVEYKHYGKHRLQVTEENIAKSQVYVAIKLMYVKSISNVNRRNGI